ncbi:MAG: secretin N-terminal domain-containing protein [Duodenibacillus sp.]|nr:secretin N-terminal domain-containing protein [Duodenibacillus sp.]
MKNIVLRTLTAALALSLLTGCATRTEGEVDSSFMKHWQRQAIDRQGFSPAEEDLNPEPRVLMRQSATVLAGQHRALPSMPVTLRMQAVPVGTVLRTMASAAKVSLVISPAAQGTVNLDVRGERWSDVFESVLAGAGLRWRWYGKILQVMTIEEQQRMISLTQLGNQLAEQQSLAEHTGPMQVSVVNVRYTEATELQKSLAKFLTRNKDAVIEIDQHNNALILQATEPEQRRLLALIEHLDRPRAQVQLKAYIVETTKEKARELGVQWGGQARMGHGNNQTFVGSGGVAGNPSNGRIELGGGNTLSNIPMGFDYSSIINGVASPNLGVAFGQIGGNMLEAQLSMMEREGVLNILSSPSITTLDNKMAYTENGEKVPYVSRNGDGDTDVKFEDAVLRLEMTPNVIDKNNLKLKVLIKKDEVDNSRAVEGNPFIVKKQTQTTLLVRSGETIVISGLSKERGNGADAGVPGLRNLPGGKYLFGAMNRTSTMEEVLIFITPVILPTRTQADRDPKPMPKSPTALHR